VIDCQSNGLVGWLIARFVDWLVGWLVALLLGCFGVVHLSFKVL
jgi:hypothetical protein